MGKRRVLAGRYELVELAAQGTGGSVYRAMDLTAQRQVAVKLVNLIGEDDYERFRREAELLAAVDHPNVVRYLGHGVAGDATYYLAQEWIEGVTLRQHLGSSGCTPAEVVRLARGVASALATIHGHGIVHRDVKPENLILAGGDPGNVKLVDFGIARATNPNARLTSTGVAVGTPAYMAPEQARGERWLGPEVDVWALGCVLYEALTGRPAFLGSTTTAIRAKVILDEVPAVQSLCPEAPARLAALIARMLSKLPSRRLLDGTEVVAALADVVVEDGGRRKPASAPVASTLQLALPPTPPGAEPAAARSIVFLTFLEGGEANFANQFDAVEQAAWRNQLDVHILDGAALLVSRRDGQGGALDAAAAAIGVRASASGAVICVVAQGLRDPLADAIDRGAEAFERATIRTMFAGVVDSDLRVPVDDIVARLIQPTVQVEQSGSGMVLAASNWEHALRGRTSTAPPPTPATPAAAPLLRPRRRTTLPVMSTSPAKADKGDKPKLAARARRPTSTKKRGA